VSASASTEESPPRTYALIIIAINILVGKKFFESAACSEKLSLNAARPIYDDEGGRGQRALGFLDNRSSPRYRKP
jgi:hypothetical protein